MEIQRGNSFQCFCDISPNLSTKKRKNFYLFHLKTISLKQNLNIFIKSPNRNRIIFPKIISPSISKSFLSYLYLHLFISQSSQPRNPPLKNKISTPSTIHPHHFFIVLPARTSLPPSFFSSTLGFIVIVIVISHC